MDVVAIGECMIELSDIGQGAFRAAFGGDTLNTAVYLARLGMSVGYATALGTDSFSTRMLENWRSEQISTDLAAQVADRLPGLYMIELDEQGDRRFHYWRSQSPARQYLKFATSAMRERITSASWLYLSGITLSLYDSPDRDDLLSLVRDLRANGGRVAFDSNYRPAGWPTPNAARSAMADLLPLVDLALPTFGDEQALHGDETPQDTAARLRALGVAEVVVKTGADGCVVAWDDDHHPVSPSALAEVVDTTAAGDAFNAAYLAGRTRGLDPLAAAHQGNLLAGRVIGHRGAIVPRPAMADLMA